jgi:hypothetical protein
MKRILTALFGLSLSLGCLGQSYPSVSINEDTLFLSSSKDYVATTALNVVFDIKFNRITSQKEFDADVKNIAIFNIKGEQVNMFKVGSTTSASLNVENLPAGIYFVRLMNGNGEVGATRKFTKQ